MTAWLPTAVRLLAVVSLVALSGCTQAPTDDLHVGPVRPQDFPAGSTMHRLYDKGRITVGVALDKPNLSLTNPRTGLPEGFDIEIAKIVATSLGLRADQIVYVRTLVADRTTYLQDGTVDVVINTFSITDSRKQIVAFAGPYFRTGQDLLVRRADQAIGGPDDLTGRPVCALTGSTSLTNIEQNYPTMIAVSSPTYTQCLDLLQASEVDAVTSDGAILLGYAAQAPNRLRVVGNPFSVELYGIGLTRDDTEFRYFLDDVLQEAIDDGRWRRAYDATLGLSGTPAPDPPLVHRY